MALQKILTVSAILVTCTWVHAAPVNGTGQLHYPKAQRGADPLNPYQQFETLNSSVTQQFINDQNKLSYGYLSSYPRRDEVSKLVKNVTGFPVYSCPDNYGDYYYFRLNDPAKAQEMVMRQRSFEEKEEVFFDPNTLSSDGSISLNTYQLSDDGKYFAYALSQNGSDWVTVKLMDAQSKKDLSDNLVNVKFSSLTWLNDNSGFFYSQYERGTDADSQTPPTLYFHKLNTKQQDDIAILKASSADRIIYSTLSRDKQFLTISVGVGSKNDISVLPLTGSPHLKPFPKVQSLDAINGHLVAYIVNYNDTFIFQTDQDAPNSKLISYDVKTKKSADLISEQEFPLLAAVPVKNKKFVAIYVEEMAFVYYAIRYDNKSLTKISVEAGAMSCGTYNYEKNESFIGQATYLSPGKIYRFDLSGEEVGVKVVRDITVPVDLSAFESKQLNYTSKDGTVIPMTVIARKDVIMNGQNPTVLYGYGGFGVSQSPTFSKEIVSFLKLSNGVFAVANIRGGGEFGKKWHEAGKQANKQNSFDDFQAAAQFLISRGYASPAKLSIYGASNGGLLTAASMLQAPQLFGAVIADVGLFDMLRFHKFPPGQLHIDEYGNPEVDDQRKYLQKYSPYHNVKSNVDYPPTLIITGDSDQRVVPSHSYKFIAELQYQQQKNASLVNPLLLKVIRSSGHGANTNQLEQQQTADMLVFLSKALKFTIQL
ncbi:hypothetical protein MIR68_008177 [Amoeboaphelidium protococcarum]|nr:hypothetical protein MIR68_008177 [Amoeboaphelidium protococcarum]